MTENQSQSADVPSGFKATPVSFDNDSVEQVIIPMSRFSEDNALEFAQLIELSDGEGTILFYPLQKSSGIGVNLEIGDVLFLRERSYFEAKDDTDSLQNNQKPEQENGVIVQIISKGTASYPQADVKALFRLTTKARASILNRSHNEPTDMMDDFQVANFKVRASIQNNNWSPTEGKVVSRNVDIFFLTPSILAKNILTKIPNLNLNVGDYKNESVIIFGGGFDKVNLITGMKGAGKSHIAKGIISECLNVGMSAVVFDINNEYHSLPNSITLFPTKNLKFRLDRIPARAFIDTIDKLAPFAEKTGQKAKAELPDLIEARSKEKDAVVDIQFLKNQVDNIIGTQTKSDDSPRNNMRYSYLSSLNTVENYKLFIFSFR
ncbi:MAG: DUF87 domain-containing protein [Anaerolineales bacterium]|nr:DUF87 domain-containing protein [Anaerolineales bacterium]